MKKWIACIMVFVAGLMFGVFPNTTIANAEETEKQIFDFSNEEELSYFSASGVSVSNSSASLVNGSMQTKNSFNGAISYLTLTYQTGFSVSYGEKELYFDGTTVTCEETSVACVLPQNEFTLFFRFLQSGVRIGVASEQDYLDKVYETVASFTWATEELANKLGIKVGGEERVTINEWQIYTLSGVISGETENYDPNDTMRPEKETNTKDSKTGCAGMLGTSSTVLCMLGLAVIFMEQKAKRRGK